MNDEKSQTFTSIKLDIGEPLPPRSKKRFSKFENSIRRHFPLMLMSVLIFQIVSITYFELFSLLKIGITDEPTQHPLNWIRLIIFIVSLSTLFVSLRVQWLNGSTGLTLFYLSLIIMLGLLTTQLLNVSQLIFGREIIFKAFFDNINYLFITTGVMCCVIMLYVNVYKAIRKLNYSKITTKVVVSQCFYIMLLSFAIIFLFSYLEWSMNDYFKSEALLKYSNGDKVNNFFDFFYFNTITYFTVGYGDIVATSIFSKVLSIIESFISHLNALILIALIILNKREIIHEVKEYRLDMYLGRIFISLQILWVILFAIQFIPSIRIPSWSVGTSVSGFQLNF
ncbi:ion channel [Paenibacillus radicis (ex Xue et al. 2023)]|uniref:Ion channel n=1 Tax=Paenibacillus radicis (ex Xue et al. 2023) TaxID=2972489 RepID=A0ABT1YL38_9BACL|nr:ion channel [Paenibacillus radicis (ex Xue et al. 2023)]MCR8633906.1 ion channel [Paenibacillus radicis (ex Xue et al. 2023)]